jgi:hypothetical protein
MSTVEIASAARPFCTRVGVDTLKRFVSSRKRRKRNLLPALAIFQVKLLLDQPNIDVNRRNNDRLTSFMLAMHGGPLIGPLDSSWSGWDSSTTHDKLRRLVDLPASSELEMSRHDRWTALMEACNFGHKAIVELLLAMPSIDLEATNLRGQKAEEVATSRGHDNLAQLIHAKRYSREQPEELPRIRELEEQVRVVHTKIVLIVTQV